MNATTSRGTLADRRLRVCAGLTWWPASRVPAGQHDHGATSVEYALMISLIALVIIASVTIFGRNAINLFNVPSSAFNP